MTVYLVISPQIYCIYTGFIWFWPTPLDSIPTPSLYCAECAASLVYLFHSHKSCNNAVDIL